MFVILKERIILIRIFFILVASFLVLRIFGSDLSISDIKYINIPTALNIFLPIVSSISLAAFLFVFRIPIRINKIDVILLLYTIFQSVNYFVKYEYYNENLIIFLCCVLTSILLKQLYSQNGTGKYVLEFFSVILVVFGIIEAIQGQLQILGIAQTTNSQSVVTGLFNYPGPFAILLGSILVYSGGLLLFRRELDGKYTKLLTVLSMGLILIAVPIIPSTQSRSAWIGLIAGVAFMLYIKYEAKFTDYFRRIRNSSWFYVLLPVSAFMVLVIGWLLYILKAESVHGRLHIWTVTLNYFGKNPITGLGYGQFKYEFGKIQSHYMVGKVNDLSVIYKTDYVKYVFNDFLQILVENGIIAFLLFVAYLYFVAKILKSWFLDYNPFTISAFGAFISIIVACLFSYPLEIPMILTVFFFFGSILSFYDHHQIATIESRSLLSNIALPLAVLGLLFICKREVQFYKVKATVWNDGLNSYNQQHFRESVRRFEKAYQILPNEPELLMVYGKALYEAGDFEKSRHILESAAKRTHDSMLYLNLGNTYVMCKEYALAEKTYKEAILTTPDRLYPRYMLVNLYQKTGNILLAKQEAKNVTRIKVPVASLASDSIYAHMHRLLQ